MWFTDVSTGSIFIISGFMNLENSIYLSFDCFSLEAFKIKSDIVLFILEWKQQLETNETIYFFNLKVPEVPKLLQPKLQLQTPVQDI